MDVYRLTLKNIKIYKELKSLWRWLEFVLWCGNWEKAKETCQKIDVIAKQYPIINFFAMILH